MPSRREFLQIGITATAWPLAAGAGRAAGADIDGDSPLAVYKTVYDCRFAESVEFARRAEALGLSVQAIEGDMTRLWYDDLYYRWQQGPAAIAGLTGHGAMFCFEQLGRDQGLRLVFKAEHRFAAERIEHDLYGPLPMLRDGMALNETGRPWSACMADAVAACPSGRAEVSRIRARTAASRIRDPQPEALYTWVIAPARGSIAR